MKVLWDCMEQNASTSSDNTISTSVETFPEDASTSRLSHPEDLDVNVIKGVLQQLSRNTFIKWKAKIPWKWKLRLKEIDSKDE